jgi:hypothetical protein
MNIGGAVGAGGGYWSLFANNPTQPINNLDYNISINGTNISPPEGCQFNGPAAVVRFNGVDTPTSSGANVGCTVRAGDGGSIEYVLHN